MNKRLSPDDIVSNCCGAPPKTYAGPGGTPDSDSSDHGICPECGDGCEYVTFEEYSGMGDEDPETTYYKRIATCAERFSGDGDFD